MAENERPQNDFFSDLMFGRTEGLPRSVPPEVKEEETKESNSQSINLGQLAQILTIIETVGVTVEKLTPLLNIAQTFLLKKKEEGASAKTKKENTDQ